MSTTHEANPMSPETSVVIEVMVASLAAGRSVFEELAEMTEDLVADPLTGEALSSLVQARRDRYTLAEASVSGFTPGKVLMLLTEATTPERHLSYMAAGLVLDWFMRNLNDEQLPAAVRSMAPLLGTYSVLSTTQPTEEG